MSYQVLARKYRPKDFSTLVGQEHVVRALSHALDSGRLHHAYLFTGTRGVGKTTLSRILAKAFNCRGEDGNGLVTSQPCGVCSTCIAIDAGRFVDYIEIDAASNRGVEEMAQLLEQAVYSPSDARYKVYMIDEVHMLTNHAFNAMLKTLEEPPSHVKFILATTDPQKIPVTVLSRCLQFNLKQMPPAQIVSHLENILGLENIDFEPGALRLLAQGAQGSMRDALSLTDQAIAYAAGTVSLEAVQGMLGALDQTFLIQILDALSSNDGATLIAIAEDMATRSLSYNAALQDLGSLLHRIALAQTVPTAISDALPERADILRLAGCLTAEEVQLFYQIAVHGRNELGLAPDDFAGFSMTLLRMLAFRPGMGAADDVTTPVAKGSTPAGSDGSRATFAATDRLPLAAVTDSVKPAGRASAALAAAMPAAKGAVSAALVEKVEAMTPALTTSSDTATYPATNPARDALIAARSNSKMAASSKRSSGEPSAPKVLNQPSENLKVDAIIDAALHAAISTSNAEPMVVTPVEALGWDGHWPKLAAGLQLRGVVQQLAQQSELLRCEQQMGLTVLHLQVAVGTLCVASTVEKLTAALTSHFGKPIRIETLVGPVTHTANAAMLADQAERQHEAEQTMQSDPFVQSLIREFGATIVPGSIKPVPLS
jgi:DNA polymerase-3 subunit gamma/tau